MGYEASPGTGFDTLEDIPEVDITDDPYGGLVAALRSVTDAADGADITAWAISPAGEVTLLGVLDQTGRPLFTLGAAEGGVVGQLLGRNVIKTSHVADTSNGSTVLGVAGDWGSAVWGYVEAIQIDVSDQAPLTDVDGTQINLWQRNMIAVRAECEIGFAARDDARFVRLTHSGNGNGG